MVGVTGALPQRHDGTGQFESCWPQAGWWGRREVDGPATCLGREWIGPVDGEGGEEKGGGWTPRVLGPDTLGPSSLETGWPLGHGP